MKRDDIIRMAREASAMFDHMTWVERDLYPVFERFAALVAAAEREACAKVCEEFEFEFADDSAGTLIDVAKAIRARGEK